MTASYWREPVINVTKPIEERVLNLIKKKFQAKEVFIEDKDLGKKKIRMTNTYNNVSTYAEFSKREELNAFLSGYYSCWSDLQ